jgi:flagellar assembly protein FliH
MAETPTIRKFMFEHSFDDGSHVVKVRESKPVLYKQEQIDALKKESYDAGFAAGQKIVEEDQSQRTKKIVTQIDARIGDLLAAAAASRRQQEMSIREAALAIARKILPDYAKRNGLAEIQALIAGVLGEMPNEPRLVVRVNETQFDSVSAALKEVTEKQAYGGKVVLLADAETAADNCLIEWADGGIERNLQSLWQNIGQTVAPGAGPLTAPSPEPASIEAPAPESAKEETKHG